MDRWHDGMRQLVKWATVAAIAASVFYTVQVALWVASLIVKLMLVAR